MILVTHDLGVVADIADRIAVMYAGRIIEEGTLDQIFYDPQHPYTWGLLGSITRVDRPRPERLPAIEGLPPSLANRPEGCHFRPRCPHEFAKCIEIPPLESRVRRAAEPPRPLLALARGQAPAARGEAGRDRAAGQGRGGSRRMSVETSATTPPDTADSNGSSPLISVEHLKVFFPIKQGIVIDREVARVHAVNDVTLVDRRGRDARPRGRVGLREDDDVAHASCG